MKKIIVILMAGVMLMSFSAPVNERLTAGELTELTGYKLRDNKINHHDFNLWVVTNEDVFSRDFEPLHDSVLRPRFDEQMVLAAKVETVSNTYRVKFKKTIIADGTLNVYLNVKREAVSGDSEKLVSMIVVPKDKVIRKVNFFHDNVLVKSVPIVTVY